MATETKRRVKEVRRLKVHGVWRWQARVIVQGLRVSRQCDTEEEAKVAKAELRLEAAKAVSGNFPPSGNAIWQHPRNPSPALAG